MAIRHSRHHAPPSLPPPHPPSFDRSNDRSISSRRERSKSSRKTDDSDRFSTGGNLGGGDDDRVLSVVRCGCRPESKRIREIVTWIWPRGDLGNGRISGEILRRRRTRDLSRRNNEQTVCRVIGMIESDDEPFPGFEPTE